MFFIPLRLFHGDTNFHTKEVLMVLKLEMKRQVFDRHMGRYTSPSRNTFAKKQ